MNPHRDQLIDRALLKALLRIGHYLLPEESLLAEVSMLIGAPPLLHSEFTDRLRNIEARGLILGTPSDYGVKWKLTDAGRAFCSEHRI